MNDKKELKNDNLNQVNGGANEQDINTSIPYINGSNPIDGGSGKDYENDDPRCKDLNNKGGAVYNN